MTPVVVGVGQTVVADDRTPARSRSPRTPYWQRSTMRGSRSRTSRVVLRSRAAWGTTSPVSCGCALRYYGAVPTAWRARRSCGWRRWRCAGARAPVVGYHARGGSRPALAPRLSGGVQRPRRRSRAGCRAGTRQHWPATSPGRRCASLPPCGRAPECARHLDAWLASRPAACSRRRSPALRRRRDGGRWMSPACTTRRKRSSASRWTLQARRHARRRARAARARRRLDGIDDVVEAVRQLRGGRTIRPAPGGAGRGSPLSRPRRCCSAWSDDPRRPARPPDRGPLHLRRWSLGTTSAVSGASASSISLASREARGVQARARSVSCAAPACASRTSDPTAGSAWSGGRSAAAWTRSAARSPGCTP